MSGHSAYPLQWPAGYPRTAPEKRKRARFGRRDHYRVGTQSLTVAQARGRLMEEIEKFTKAGHTWRIQPDHVVISTNMGTRKDGLPRSGAREPNDPGVAVYLWLDGEPHVFPCDAWDRVADNIAAIAAHLGALRGIERWRVGDLRQAFTAWRALPESAGGHSWREVLGVGPDATLPEVEAAYRRRRREAHPDSRGGSSAAFQAVQEAWQQAQEALNSAPRSPLRTT